MLDAIQNTSLCLQAFNLNDITKKEEGIEENAETFCKLGEN